MPLNMKLWRIKSDGSLADVERKVLDSETRLEDWIAKDSSLLAIELLLIGRQVTNPYGGRIDLLGIDRQGDISIIELKRDRTPRDVIAQILDYASWVRQLTYNELDSISVSYLNKSLSVAFNEFFGEPIPENVNISHKMLIVASEFDDSSERIVQYLADEYQVNINAIFFSFFTDTQGDLVGRAWLMDPEAVQDRAESRKQAPWSGYWFVNVGEGPHRNWEDNVKYGYIGAGQGPKYSEPLKKLKEGDEIFAYMKGLGYVGYGVIISQAQMSKDFVIDDNGNNLLQVPLKAPNVADNKDDPQFSEWAVKVNWRRTFQREHAKYFKGIFANQNIVCKLRHQETVEFLKKEFELNK